MSEQPNPPPEASQVDEPAPETPAFLSKPDEQPAPPRRARWPVVLAAAVVAGGAFWGWKQFEALQSAERRAAEWQNVADMLGARIDALDGEIDTTRERQKVIETRIGENAATGRVIREEMLAISERAGAVEAAIDRLASQREQADVAMRLNEVDFLLQMGQQRFELFADVDTARAAFTTAASALSVLDLPAMQTVQQTVEMERDQLQALPADVRPALRARVGEVAQRIDGLPAPAVQTASTEDQPRILQSLSRLGLLHVRRVGDDQQLISPLERGSRIAALRLHLDLALAALDRFDAPAWAQHLDAALSLSGGLFDGERAEVSAVLAHLQQARGTPLVRPALELGAALRELRALRGQPQLPRYTAEAAGEQGADSGAAGGEAGPEAGDPAPAGPDVEND